MAVNFTGNVKIDFPEAIRPGIVVLRAGPDVIQPQIPPHLEPFIPVSGLELTGIRLAYDAVDDVLSIGLEQPPNGITGQDVIAGDVDDNLNGATVSPLVELIEPGFIDFPDLMGTETMGAFLDLTGDGLADIVAGIPNQVGLEKFYQVATAVVNPGIPTAIPDFGIPLPQFTGNVYLVNSRFHPNFEFAIQDFSELYLLTTGRPLTRDTVIGVGAFANSGDDNGISEAFFPAQPVPFEELIPPPEPPLTNDLSIVKADVPDPVGVGQVLTYVLTVRNAGPGAATGVVVTDNLPVNARFLSAIPSQGTVTEAGGVLTADLGTLAPGASAQITVGVIPTAPGNIVNTARVTGFEPDVNPVDNEAQVPTTVLPGPIPPPPPVCPPLEPPILINPHAHRHVNTAHPSLIRVNIFGSTGFNVGAIRPETVRLGGASPVNTFTRRINRDKYPDATFVFRGTDVDLPAGITDATLTGRLATGEDFAATTEVFNRNEDFYRTRAVEQQQERLARRDMARRDEPEPVVMRPNAQAVRLGPTVPAAAQTAGGPAFNVRRPAGTFFALNRRANLGAAAPQVAATAAPVPRAAARRDAGDVLVPGAR